MSEHDELIELIELIGRLTEQVAELSAQVQQLLSRAPIVNVYPHQPMAVPYQVPLTAPNGTGAPLPNWPTITCGPSPLTEHITQGQQNT